MAYAEVIALAESIRERCVALREKAQLPESVEMSQVEALLAELTQAWESRQ